MHNVDELPEKSTDTFVDNHVKRTGRFNHLPYRQCAKTQIAFFTKNAEQKRMDKGKQPFLVCCAGSQTTVHGILFIGTSAHVTEYLMIKRFLAAEMVIDGRHINFC